MRNLLDLDFPDRVAELLDKWRLAPTALELEITESTIMADPVRAMHGAGRLNEMGVKLSIDDFGTGYSSLAYLKRLPVDELKIDKSFVLDMTADENDAAIVRSTIDLGAQPRPPRRRRGRRDEPRSGHELRDLGCDLAQGYLVSRPLPADQLTAWLHQRRDAAAAAEAATTDAGAARAVANGRPVLVPGPAPQLAEIRSE